MKYKHIIGLDIGTNSLGWSLIKEYEDNSVEVIKTGVHIFPIGTIVDEKSNKEKTKNEQRRGYRGASRMRYRFKLRRKNLKLALSNLGMLPDYSKLHKPKDKKRQSYELYKLRADAIDSQIKIPLQEIGRIFMLLNKYRGFKSNSKKLQQKDSESGKVKKGYESLQKLIDNSGAKTIGQYFFKMHETARRWYDEDKWHNPNEPIDERAYNDNGEFVLFNSNGIRRHHGRYTLRDMYLLEFDKIWAAQKKHYREIFTGSKEEYEVIIQLPYKERIEALKKFKESNYWHIRDYCIYYQRPLKSQKKYVSTCQFERGVFDLCQYTILENEVEKLKKKRIWKKKAKKACPKSHPYFQEFRIWQKLHQINYSSVEEDVFNKPLKGEWLKIIADTLMSNLELFLNKTTKIVKENRLWFGKILQENGLIKNSDMYTFHIDKADEDIDHEEKSENRIIGNVTYSSFLNALGEETFNRLKKETTKRREWINKEQVIEIEESKLLLLWHHLYIAKDGLFKEDDWLKCILTEPAKWGFTPEQAQRLIETGLQADYGSYSCKVLKAILPEMRKGINEYEALKIVNKGYINEDNTIGHQIKLKDKISQLSYQELRNPVVERALSKTIKVVNKILEKYKEEIDKDTFEIRIESTRQFKKPRQERENERRKNAEKDKLREQYADYLTKNKEKLGFKKDIYKHDSIVGKYELWLQMNMNEDDEAFIREFKSFSKITKQEDRLKHRLWLECGRRCPYTGDVINLTDCFSSEIEIEHIIPLSRSLDNSFNNKTLTKGTTNALKGKMTPLEYLEKVGANALKKFKENIKGGNNAFSDSKKAQFLTEKIGDGFLSQQLSNTSYIAKYTREKMREVCRNVQFTNGSATSELRNKDWGLSTLLDKIRYEEDYGINMDAAGESGIYVNYSRIRESFRVWCEKKYKSTDIKIEWKNLKENKDVKEYFNETNDDLLYWYDEIEKFKQYRNENGKKDRSDHRHHAIDAFITACCSPEIIKLLSTYNAIKEEQHLHDRDKIDKPFNYYKLKESISAILVSHSEQQNLIKKRRNKIKTKDGVKEFIAYAPQGKLHEESFYAKRNDATVRRVELFDDQRQEKPLFAELGKLDYLVKGNVKWSYIEDKQLYEIVKQRLIDLKGKAFTKEKMERNPFYRVSPATPDKWISKKKNKPLPIIKSIRKRFNVDRTLINLSAKDEKGMIVTENRYADNDSNYLIVFYKKDKHVFARPISFFNAVKNKTNRKPLIPDEIEYRKVIYGIDEEMPWLKSGDIIYIYKKDERSDDIDWTDNLLLKDRLYKVKGFSTKITRDPKYGDYEFGNTSLLNIKRTKADGYPSKNNIDEALKLYAFTLSHDKLRAIKVRIDILGEIERTGRDCFLSAKPEI